MSKRIVFIVTLISLYSVVLASDVKVFVSSSMGKDYNSGYSENEPLKSINYALNKGNIICLKAGDVFYEDIVVYNKKIIRYGKGNNPKIIGYKRNTAVKWVPFKKNIWKLDLNDKGYEGYLKSTSKGILNNIGFFHEIEKDVIHGRKVKTMNDLKSDWDFFQQYKVNDEKEELFRYVYLYLERDPNEMNMEMATGTIGVILYKSSLENINLEGFGFGVSLLFSGIIRGCKIDAIGGRILNTSKSFICDGNGIGIWIDQNVDTKNVLVEDCYISRVFDAGICLQGSSGGIATAKNVVCRNNLIVNCCQGWEDVLNNSSLKPYEECIFENNIVVFSGNSGFGYYDKRSKYCHILGNNRTTRKLLNIKENIFIGGNYYCSALLNKKYNSNLWINNKCYLTEGNYLLSQYSGLRDVLIVNTNNFKNQIKEYRKLTDDNSTEFYLKKMSYINKMGKKYISNYLKTHSY